jgi:hypothetical protein
LIDLFQSEKYEDYFSEYSALIIQKTGYIFFIFDNSEPKDFQLVLEIDDLIKAGLYQTNIEK